MGGRGSSGIGIKNSAEYKAAYREEIGDRSFYGDFALNKGATKSSIAYEMGVYKDATGRSLVADLKNEIAELRRAHKENGALAASYGLSRDTTRGIADGIREKISVRMRAVSAMESARSEYEENTAKTRRRNAKNKGRKWM